MKFNFNSVKLITKLMFETVEKMFATDGYMIMFANMQLWLRSVDIKLLDIRCCSSIDDFYFAKIFTNLYSIC